MTVEIDTERVRQLAADLEAQRDAVSRGPSRCLALSLPGGGAAVTALVGQVLGAEQALSETVAAAADACATVLRDTTCSVTAADRHR